MKPYDPKAVCPKCGHSDVSSEYCSGIYPDHGYYDPPHPSDDEAIHRRCLRCQYGWAEAVPGAESAAYQFGKETL